MKVHAYSCQTCASLRFACGRCGQTIDTDLRCSSCRLQGQGIDAVAIETCLPCLTGVHFPMNVQVPQ